MSFLNTEPYRVAGEKYRIDHELAPQKGFVVHRKGPLMLPGRKLFYRISKNMEAQNNLAVGAEDTILPFPGVHATAILTKAFRNALIPPKPKLTLGDKAVAYAMTQVGVHESPWGSNEGEDVRRYQSSTGAYGAAWCASFVSYCWQKAGYQGSVSAGAWNLTDRCGTRVADVRHAKPGDAVSLNEGQGHVGLFCALVGDQVRLIAGNTNNQVAVRDYPVKIIHSISRPL